MIKIIITTLLLLLPNQSLANPYDLDIKEGWLSGRKQLIANESDANTVPEVRILYPPPENK
jgi:hypothetical protein